MAEIFLHNVGHGHAQRCGEILSRHDLLLFGIAEKRDQTVGESLSIARGIEFDRQFLTLGHLAEIGQVGADDGHAIGASQMRDTAAAGRRRIGHDRHARTLKQGWKVVLGDVTAKFDAGIPQAFPSDRFGIPMSLGMIAPSDYELGFRHPGSEQIESFDHQLESLVRSPFSKCQNAVFGIAAL